MSEGPENPYRAPESVPEHGANRGFRHKGLALALAALGLAQVLLHFTYRILNSKICLFLSALLACNLFPWTVWLLKRGNVAALIMLPWLVFVIIIVLTGLAPMCLTVFG